MSNRFCYDTRPLALKENIIKGENYRFTLLTERLIRLEYSSFGTFEDRATQSVFYRDFTPVKYTAVRKNGVLQIETRFLKLTYKENCEFCRDTLSAELLCKPYSTYCYGDSTQNLGGTARTLDNVDGKTELGGGVCARGGFAVIDDSDTLAIDGESGWVALKNKGNKDIYLFGYGYDYSAAVKDCFRLTGTPPMLPAYALGNWWSRYHKYTQDEYTALIEKFKAKDIPLSVAVIDMDWHIVDIAESEKQTDVPDYLQDGWTGYTWNKELFPDYKDFLNYLHKNNLRTSLNLHPHAGIRRHEAQYEEMAKAMGINPQSKKHIPFDILNPSFMEKYFDILHHPYEKDGVDFWWMDWQQGTGYWWIHEENKDGKLKNELEALDPLWMLNHLHIKDIARNGKRPMFFSRFCGVGSGRYPIGFSGDTFITWESLKFQPYFTATASNIGYPWWSHDIGGHQGGYYDEELTTRWIQLGVFSPVNRLHSTATTVVRKEPWLLAPDKEKIATDYLRLRHMLFPYIYTMNYRTHTLLEPIITPMYYQYPECDFAYENKTQFFFGTELFVAPVVEKAGADNLSKADVFLPQGIWFDFFDGTPYIAKKDTEIKVFKALAEYPVFARAGAIVPMQQHIGDNILGNSAKMLVNVFAGADNRFTLYEDKGEYNTFEEGEFAETEMALRYGEGAEFTLLPPKGDTSFLPRKREWRLQFKGFNKSATLSAFVNGKRVEAECGYNKAENAHTVTVCTEIENEIKIVLYGEAVTEKN